MKTKTVFGKLTAWFLALAFCLTLLPALTLPAAANTGAQGVTAYALYIGGTQVTDANRDSLGGAIKAATALSDAVQWDFPPIAAGLKRAIDDARQVADNPNATGKMVEDALEALTEAVRTAMERIAEEIKTEAELRSWRILLSQLQSQGRAQQKKDPTTERPPVTTTAPRRVK